MKDEEARLARTGSGLLRPLPFLLLHTGELGLHLEFPKLSSHSAPLPVFILSLSVSILSFLFSPFTVISSIFHPTIPISFLSGPHYIFLTPFSFLPCVFPFLASFFQLPSSVPRKFYISAKKGSSLSSANFQRQAFNTEFVSHQHSKFFLLILFFCIPLLVHSVHRADRIPVVPKMTIFPCLHLPGPGESWPSQTAVQLVRTETSSPVNSGNMAVISWLSVFTLLFLGAPTPACT